MIFHVFQTRSPKPRSSEVIADGGRQKYRIHSNTSDEYGSKNIENTEICPSAIANIKLALDPQGVIQEGRVTFHRY